MATQLVGVPALPLHLKNNGGQRQKAMVLVQMAGADRQLRGHDRIGDRHRTAGRIGLQTPTGRISPRNRQGLAVLVGLQPLQLFDVITDQVRARGPARKRDPLFLVGSLKTELDAHEMTLRVAQIKLDLNRSSHRCRFS